MPNGLVKELTSLEPAQLRARDVRARHPPLRNLLLRFETLRRLARVGVLAALDAAAVFLAIWTALELKAVVHGESNLSATYHQATHWAPLAILVTLAQLEHHFNEVDEVLIADPDFPQEQAVDLVARCHRHGIRVRVAPSTMEIVMDRVEFVPGQTLPLFELKPPVFEGIDFVVKRSFDIVVAALLVLVLSPVLVLAALAVKLTSRGPIIYPSRRPGIGEVPFGCFKFRTMYADADERQATLERENEMQGAIFKMRNDPRVTRIGRFLRRWSIDELPQLFNVLRGEMSLVGPRPPLPSEVDQYEDWQWGRLRAVPGLTGLWQVSGRSEVPFHDMVRLDLHYIRNWSMSLDLEILLRTIPAVLTNRGAY